MVKANTSFLIGSSPNMLHFVRAFSIYACLGPEDVCCIEKYETMELLYISKTLLKMANGGCISHWICP